LNVYTWQYNFINELFDETSSYTTLGRKPNLTCSPFPLSPFPSQLTDPSGALSVNRKFDETMYNVIALDEITVQ